MLDLNDGDEVRRLLKSIRGQTTEIVEEVVRGTQDVARTENGPSREQIDSFLDKFLTARIHSNILVAHYLSISSDFPTSVVEAECDLLEVAQEAANDGSVLCAFYYNNAPPIDIICAQKKLTLPFVRKWMHYILLEVIKNSLRAVIEAHGPQCSEYPIVVTLCGDSDTVVIRVSDRGGGIGLHELQGVWSYCYTTANSEHLNTATQHNMPPIAGLGCGLPLSRSYMKFFGGRLMLNTIPKYGCETYLYFNRLGDGTDRVGFNLKRP